MSSKVSCATLFISKEQTAKLGEEIYCDKKFLFRPRRSPVPYIYGTSVVTRCVNP